MTWPRATGPRSVHQTARGDTSATDLIHSPLRELSARVAGAVETILSWNEDTGAVTVSVRDRASGGHLQFAAAPDRRSTPSITRTPTPPPSVPHDEMARPLRQVVSWVAAPPACSGEAPTRSLSEAPRRSAVASDRRARPRWRPATGGRPRPRRLPARSLARRAPASPERRPPSLPCTARTISSRSLYASSCFLQQPVFP